MTKPAYQIPLTQTQLALIGELCGIQAQIELSMQLLVLGLLKVTHETAQSILGSTNVRTNSDVWIRIMREKCQAPELLILAEHAYKEIEVLSQGRNDFIHALFAGSPPELLGASFNLPPNDPIAVRTKNFKTVTSVSKLKPLRDRAAALSCLLADLHWRACFNPDPARSPWHGKYELQPLSHHKSEEQSSGKEQKGQPQSSAE